MSDLTSRIGGMRTSLGIKAPCRCATTENIALTGFQTIDGETLSAADTNLRVLVWNQVDARENGIWDAKATNWTRAKDFNGSNDILSGTTVWVANGTDAGRCCFQVSSPDPITIGTSDIAFRLVLSPTGSPHDHNISVGNRTLLKAAPPEWLAVVLRESGREGLFLWDATTSIVTHQADTKEGIYVAPNSGAIGAWVRVHEGTLHPKWFGAAGDGSTDDTEELQALHTLAGTAYRVQYEVGANYKTTDTITAVANQWINFAGGKITYSGTRNRPALVTGSSGTVDGADIENVWIESSTIDWSSSTFTGYKAINKQRARVSVHKIRGFYTGLNAYSVGQGWTQNRVEIKTIQESKRILALTADGSSGTNYTNQNTFVGGDYTNSGVSAALGACWGVVFETVSGGLAAADQNLFLNPCFQMDDGVGDERIPILMNGTGNYNTVIGARYETGRGPFARLEGGATTDPSTTLKGNNFDVAALAGTYVEDKVTQNGFARHNYYTSRSQSGARKSKQNVVVLDLFSSVSAASSTTMFVAAPLHFASGTSATSTLANSPALYPRERSLYVLNSAYGLGTFFDVDPGDEFKVSLTGETSYGRVMVAVYDSSGALLTGGTDIVVDVTGGGNPNNFYSGLFGGSYGDSNDAAVTTFRIAGSTVAKMRVIAMGGTSTYGNLSGMTVERLSVSAKPLFSYSGVSGHSKDRSATATPNSGVIGVYSRGEIIRNSSAAAGQPAFWSATAADGARLAPAWAISTAYSLVGHLRRNGGNVYVVRTAGTSAGAGGPSGTGTSIADNTVVWDYVAPEATFLPGPNL